MPHPASLAIASPANMQMTTTRKKLAHHPERGDRHEEPALGREVEEAGPVAPPPSGEVRRVELQRDRDDDRHDHHEAERDPRARSAHLLDQLGADEPQHQAPFPMWRSVCSPTRPRNASSSWWREVTVSTAIPASTSAATSAERAPRRARPRARVTRRSRCPTPGIARAATRRASDVVDLEVRGACSSPAARATVPAVTSWPLSMTTTWLQICSISESR